MMTFEEKKNKIIELIEQNDVYTISLTNNDLCIKKFIQRINFMIKKTFDLFYDKQLEPNTFFYNALTDEAKLARYSDFLLDMYFKFFFMDFNTFKLIYVQELEQRSHYGYQMLMKDAEIYPYNL